MSRVTCRRSLAVLLAGLAVLMGACGGGAGKDEPGTPTGSSTSATSRGGESATPGPAAGDETVAQRCTGDRGTGRYRVIETKGSELVAAEVGRGPTWAVLLHQTGGDGLCGWWPYANRLAGQGVHVLLLDLCGYGRSTCVDPVVDDQIGQASAAVAYARSHGAARVTVVGASMGGAVALPSATASRADAVVDLSGPPDWPGTNLARDAKELSIPTLLVVSGDDPFSVPAFRKAIKQVPAETKRLEIVAGGHGYEMLGSAGSWSLLATTVRRWITADYS